MAGVAPSAFSVREEAAIGPVYPARPQLRKRMPGCRASSAPQFHPTISIPRRMLTIGWQKRIIDREAGNK